MKTEAQLTVLIVLVLLLVLSGKTQVYGASPSPVDLYSSSSFTLSEARELTANYTYFVNAATSPVFVLSMHIIQPFPYVEIRDMMIIVQPNMQFTNQTSVDSLGNLVLTITFRSTSNLGQFYVTVLQHFTAYSISYSVDPTKVGKYDTNSLPYKLYTQPAQYIESNNPQMTATAKEIAGGETNPYLIALKILSFVVQHMTYDMAAVSPWNPNTEGALFALTSGKGVCRHFAALFTALARADGIPTVDVWGSLANERGAVADQGDSKHNWVEFFIPNYGWISADPTLNEFARLDNAHVPVMSVNYLYQRAWGAQAQFQSVFSGEEPVISLGFQEPPSSPESNAPQPWTSGVLPGTVIMETSKQLRQLDSLESSLLR